MPPMPELHKQVEHFKHWADAIGQCYGEWECNYEYWHDLWTAAVETINIYSDGVIPTSVADDLLYALGRDNEGESIHESLLAAPKLLALTFMTELLEQAVEHLKSLDADKQDAIATLIMEELEDEAKWDTAFSSSHDLLANLAAEAMAEYNDTMVWFWIGSHAEYDKLLSQM